MGLFGSGDKEDKKQKEINALLEMYGLDELNEKDHKMIKRIATDLTGLFIHELKMATTLIKSEEQATNAYLAALVRQNWVIIGKLDEISQKLEK